MAINKDTIISIYDEKLTLLQWLKKIEKGINEATLTNVTLPVQDGQWDGFINSILDPQQTPRIGFLTNEQKDIIKNYNSFTLSIPARVSPYLHMVGQHNFIVTRHDSFKGTGVNENYIMFYIFHDDGVVISLGFREDLNALYINKMYSLNEASTQ